MKRKLMCLVLGMVMSLPAVSGFAAYELPHAFWSINDRYAAAKASGDDAGIIEAGIQAIELLSSEPENDQVREIMGSRCYDVADAYDRQDNFSAAAYYYSKYIPYGEFMNWSDGVKIARAKAQQYTSSVAAYTDAVQPQKYFGARNEPKQGVLYGQISEETQPDDSMILLYINYGDMPNDWDNKIFKDARESGKAIEVAWNIQGEGSALSAIPYQGDYVERFLSALNEYSDVPMYLRIGAEMNIWGNKPDPEEFKVAFRFLADAVHSRASHVATVWSVAHNSEWNTKMEDFYPGDEYVDWIGISTYAIRHFQGRTWAKEERFNEVCFSAGDAADPVMIIKEVMDKFGGRKPVMLAECGCAHTTVSMGADNTDWAVTNLERMYNFIPMVYPEVKLIAYFNTYIPSEINNYSLNDNYALKQKYESVVKGQHFIRNRYSDGSDKKTYQPITDGMVLAQKVNPIYAYPHVYGDDKPSVRYSIDGNIISESRDIPYRVDYNFANCGIGEHILKAEAISNGRVADSVEYKIYVTENIPIEVNGRELLSDTVPVMKNDRVLVPMRVIFESLGADVSWEDSTQTAKASKNGMNLEITINSNRMIKNGGAVTLDVPAEIINGRTMVPVRAVSEALNAKVGWIESQNKVTVDAE